ncbi:kynureninase [Spirosoma sordidisoli]|uniref:Kynureninase n=1 Tax=Spirosoma sordidisoli TaxID=2502893 RepID=A0A4Q2UJI6_9BACT|nr:kynureninase [Spirosoma sordidisoli]RYC69316.1 kynureninase [Spirosoma sordidisoli]
MTYENTLDFARQLDADDSLRSFRNRFYIPQRNGTDLVYLCGNSLGLQPKSARAALDQELTTWQQLGVEGWFDKPEGAEQNWLGYHNTCKGALGQVVGADPAEVCPMNALTVNLHLLLASFYRPGQNGTSASGKPKYKILTIKGDFPSDQYALETHLQHHGLTTANALVEVAPRPADGLIHTTDIQAAIAEHADELALVWMSGLNYYTGQVYNMAALAEAARRHNVPIGLDLAHALGNVPLRLHDWGVDFATWCSYKYLNGGPGAVSGIFIHEKHHDQNRAGGALPRLAGWWGYREDRRFEMSPGFLPAAGADGWQLSTPNIMALALHRTALAITAEAGMTALRQKSERLTGFLEHILAPFDDIQRLTPDDPNQRGCQLSLLVRRNGKALFSYLTEQGIIGDWREPDCIRLAPVPLYNTFEDVWRVGEALRGFFSTGRQAFLGE